MAGKKVIFSFFSGSGFLDLGFETNGFDIDLVNEFSPEFMRAYKYSREKMGLREPRFGYFNIDINEFLGDRKTELQQYLSMVHSDGDLVGFIGGPPCPDFSIAGKNRGRNGDNGKLSKSYVDLIIAMQPDFFLFENVKGLWKTARHREFYEELKSAMVSVGYVLTDRLTNALEFGAPQDRDRILLFGIKSELLFSPEKIKHSEKQQASSKTKVVIVSPDFAETISALQRILPGTVTAVSQGVYSFESSRLLAPKI